MTPIAEKAAKQLDAELWGVEFLREGGDWVLRISIDKPNGVVDMDLCEAFSKTVDPMLDEADPVPHAYTLEVSSAGAERVLRNDADLERFLGSYIEIRLYSPIDKQKELLGDLTAFNAEALTLDGKMQIPRKNIAQTRLRIKF